MVLLAGAGTNVNVYAKEDEKKEETKGTFSIESPSAVLMEASTGQLIYEKSADEQRKPASVTKVMTLLLIFEALDSGKLKLTDTVTVSEHAASMGGSQVFLEPGETQTVDTMIKCIAMASGNDACVAMAEHIAGSEDAFVEKMNARAKELGMEHTNFVNCCGLDVDGHVTTAKDIAIMSRELTVEHPKIFDYTKIWMDQFTHVTKRGESIFGLANTNKLLKQYQGATGLKTGSTSLAKFCLSATASRNGIDLIAVVMAAPDPKIRFKNASALLDYGFANCQIYEDKESGNSLIPAKVTRGVEKEVPLIIEEPFRYVFVGGEGSDAVEKNLILNEEIKAPIKAGEVLGKITYTANGKSIGECEVKAAKDIGKITFKISFWRLLGQFLL